MSYYIEYRIFENVRDEGNIIKEAILVDNFIIWPIYQKVNWHQNSESVRTYIIDNLKCDFHISLDNFLNRYKNNLKEEKKMDYTKDNDVVDEIREETDSYSDDSLFNITSFGTDMSFREIITMYDEGDLEKPELQRNYVWNKNEASRFIDSVLLGLPVPSIFLAKTNDEKRLIVDGYQRIMTVYDYVKRGIFGGDGKSFALSNSDLINVRWRGKTFQELLPEEKRRIRNFSIHAIVFEQKEPKDDTGMYQIFERINTGGRTLKPQEIRNCVYHGKFNKLLLKLNRNSDWRKLYNGQETDPRMADIELILRMFAFAYIANQNEITQKQINLVKYLNQFMKRNDNFQLISEEELTKSFYVIMQFLVTHFDEHLFRNGKYKDGEVVFSKKISPAIVDSVYAATLFVLREKGLEEYKHIDMNKNYQKLITDEVYQDAISKRTTNIDKIKTRIELATQKLYGETYGW